MATYRSIASTETDPQAPVTSALMKALDANATAIAEADSTVDLSLLPTVLLGTVASVSGASSTISSLVLTPYKLLLISYSLTGSVAGGGWSMLLGSGIFATGTSGQTTAGMLIVDLGNGRLGNMAAGATPVGSALSGYSTATTSVGFSITGSTASFSGSWRLYGLK